MKRTKNQGCFQFLTPIQIYFQEHTKLASFLSFEQL